MPYNSVGKIFSKTDQNGSVHTSSYDPLDRLTTDAVLTIGSGVSSGTRQIAYTYDPLGRLSAVTSYSDPTGGPSVLNQVVFTYDGFGNIASDMQEHGGFAYPTSPKVTYAYSNGLDNTTRLISTTYPNGRQIGISYGVTNGTDDWLSRINTLNDSVIAGGYANYAYLGATTIVSAGYAEPGIELSYVGSGGGDAGDQYVGLDQFGRIIDRKWNVGSSVTDEFQYGYTPASLRQWRQNVVAGTGQDEYYSYDGLYQVADRQLGTLNATKTGIIGTPAQEEQWTYDPAGNWNAYDQDDSGTSVVSQTRTNNAVNEIVTFDGSTSAITFDANGNMRTTPASYAATPGVSLFWDAWNRISGVQNDAEDT